ncbi:hypothetical protein Dimus_028269 [Dionaea muscipula]
MRIANPLNFQSPNPSTASSSIQGALQSIYSGSNGLDYGAFGRLIQLCNDRRLVRQGKQLHARLILSSVTPDNFLASKLLSFYAKTGNVDTARKVFDQIPHKNTFSYNAMLIAYTNHERSVEALTLFCSFVGSSTFKVKPDNFTVTCALKALSCLSTDKNLARVIHGYVLRHGFDSDLYVSNAMITFYSRCEEMGLTRKVFDSMRERDIVSWNSMISGYAQGGFYEDCVKLYRTMTMVEDKNLRPNGFTVVSVLQACAQLKDLVFGMEVHRSVIDNGIEMDLPVCNSIIGLYAKCGSLNHAKELFDAMTEKDEITYGCLMASYMVHGYVDIAMDLFREMKSPRLSTWNTLIAGLVQNNRHGLALAFVREMQQPGYGFKPNSVTLSGLLPSLSCLSSLRGGKEVHGYALRHGLDQNIYVATSIVDAYAKAGFLKGARRVFDQSTDNRSVIIWTSIISAYAAYGDADETIKLFRNMLSHGTRPDPVTFTAVLAACAHSGVVDEAWKIFNDMIPEYGIEPTSEHYSCMVGVLSRAGKLSDAVLLISRMPFEPSAKTWGALLNGASVFGDVELGKIAFDNLFESEPENTANYVIMSNLYLRAGRLEEAERVREMIETIGTKKIPGTSWIETSSGRLESFVASDTSCELNEEIYEALDGLSGLLREESCIFQFH